MMRDSILTFYLNLESNLNTYILNNKINFFKIFIQFF